MDSVMKQLIVTVVNTGEFSEAKKAKNALEQNGDLKSKFDSFQQKQGTLYNENTPKEQIETILKELEAEYKALTAIPEIHNYLTALEKLNQFVTSLIQKMNQGIEQQLNS